MHETEYTAIKVVKQRGAGGGGAQWLCFACNWTPQLWAAAAEQQHLPQGRGGFLIKQTWDYFVNICLPQSTPEVWAASQEENSTL